MANPPAEKRAYTMPAERLAESKRKKRAFLSAYAECYVTAEACRKVGITPYAVAHYCETDEDFKAAYLALKNLRGDMVEDAAFSRAVRGTDSPVVRNGEVVAVRKEFADGLVPTLLKGMKKETYGDAPAVNVNVGDCGVAVFGATMSQDDWQQMAKNLTRAQNEACRIVQGTAEKIDEKLPALKRA